MDLALLNPADGLVYADNQGRAFGVPIQGPSSIITSASLGRGHATVTFSGVTLVAACCPTASPGKVNSEATATNGAHCVTRSNLTAWELTETNAITLGVGMGCGTVVTRNATTVLSFCDGVWTLYRYVRDAVTSRYYFLFNGTSTDKCFPMTFTNTLVACANDGDAVFGTGTRGPNLGSGGEATVEFACCGTNTAPTAFAASPEFDVSDVRDCCEIFEVTIGGGTIYDGLWRLAKVGQTGTTNPRRWLARRYDRRAVVISKNTTTGQWQLSANSEALVPCSYQWNGPSIAGCPGTAWTYAGSIGCAGAITPTLTVRLRNCWDGTDGQTGTA